MKEIEVTNTIVSTRELPWTKLGALTDEPMTAEQAAKLGGLDFTVSLRPIQRQLQDGTWAESKHRKMVTADDTDEEFDVVSADYGILQYNEAFDFLSAINPRFVAAGTLKNRRQGFMVVQLPDLPELDMLELPNDPHELYTVVRTSHDRTRAVECAVMPLRRRCMNELGLRSFTQGVQQRWSVHHIGNVTEKLHSAEELVQRTKAYAAEFVNTANRLYGVAVDTDDARKILTRVLRDTARRDETIDKILDMWATRESVGFVGSGWGLLNAVSEYFEWDRKGGTAQSQFLNVLEGQTRTAIDKTAALILSRT